ncbi:MAG: ATP-binding protein [Salinivirgaceae bacterium]
MEKKYLVWSIIIWTLIITGFYALIYLIIVSNNKELVLNKSQAFFEQLLTSRAWNAQHYGVYVPVTETTQPNIYLEDSLRDLITVEGMKLTKINPAYMTRQISEINKAKYDIQFHITSLNPIRMANKADTWETKALQSFEKGSHEVLELVKYNSSFQYRYMAPLVTEENCMNCHAKQGYKLGSIRGGISVSFPATLYQKVVRTQLFIYGVYHFLVLILGIIALLLYYKKTYYYFSIINNKNSELLHLNADKDRFLSILAHDLKSPFLTIIGFLDLLTQNIRKYDIEKIEFQLAILNATANNTFNLLEELLTWIRSQMGKLPFAPHEFNFKSVCNDVIEMMKQNAHEKNIVITQLAADDTKGYADIEMFKTIMRNLISNAIKFTNPGGIITINAVQKHSNITFSVSDNGVGMNQKEVNKLFDVSQTYSTHGTANELGTGLGLLLCKEFVEKHGGKIWVKSEPGKGSTFMFTLATLKP